MAFLKPLLAIFLVSFCSLFPHVSSAAEAWKVELRCLALTVYHEARGEPDASKLAVAYVVMNRTKDQRFPGRICDVVYQNAAGSSGACEFSWTCDAVSDQPQDNAAWRESVRVAYAAYRGYALDPTNGAMWYHADYVSPTWASKAGVPQSLGHHLFYRAKSTPRSIAAATQLLARQVIPAAPAQEVVPSKGPPLPEATRSFLLDMNVSMMITASDPQDRAVRINGVMYREGEQLVPGLVLASITSGAIILRCQDRWFRFTL